MIKDSDLVIDFHNCWMEIPLVNVYFLSGKNVDEKNKIFFNFLDSQVWVVNLKKEKEYSGSLGGILSKINRPSLTLEIPNPEFSKEKDINNCANKLLNLLKFLGVIEGTPKRYRSSYYNIDVCEVSSIGIFTPKIELNSKVKKGDCIGFIKNLVSGELKPIFSCFEGKVLAILKESFVFPGRWVCIIGKKFCP